MPKKKTSGRKDGEGVAEYVSISQAARLRGVSPQAIDDLISRGRLGAVEIAGRRVLLRSDVLKFKPEKGGRGRKASK
jgi:excisionase family DNA binding protein